MNLIIKQLRRCVFILVLGICACSHSASLSGTYSGKNSLGYEYKVEFISSTDCIITDPRWGNALATYKVVGDRVLFNLANGGSAVFTRSGDSLNFTDSGYTVSLNKN